MNFYLFNEWIKIMNKKLYLEEKDALTKELYAVTKSNMSLYFLFLSR